jgi:hypothetical protein
LAVGIEHFIPPGICSTVQGGGKRRTQKGFQTPS